MNMSWFWFFYKLGKLGMFESFQKTHIATNYSQSFEARTHFSCLFYVVIWTPKWWFLNSGCIVNGRVTVVIKIQLDKVEFSVEARVFPKYEEVPYCLFMMKKDISPSPKMSAIFCQCKTRQSEKPHFWHKSVQNYLSFQRYAQNFFTDFK